MDALDVAAVVLGVALLWASWMCWTGRWRGFARIAVAPAVPLAVAPGVGLWVLVAALGDLVPAPVSGILIGIGVLSSTAGLIVAVWDPDWFGPRWFRERDREFDPSVPINAAVAASVRAEPAGQASEAVARRRMGGGEPEARWRAHLVSDEHGRPSALQRAGLVRGHLLLYPDGLVFAADAREDEMRGDTVVEGCRPAPWSPCTAF